MPRCVSSFLAATFSLFIMTGSWAKEEIRLYATIETTMGDIVVHLLDKKTPLTVEKFVALATGKSLQKGEHAADSITPYYNGATFHRVIPNLLIQADAPGVDFEEEHSYTVKDEFYSLGQPLTGPIRDEETADYVFEKLIRPHLHEHQGKSPVPFIADLFQNMRGSQSLEPLLGVSVEQIQTALSISEPFPSRGELLSSVLYGTLCMANNGPDSNGPRFFVVTKKEGIPWFDGKHTVFGKVTSGMEVVEAIQNVPTARPKEPIIPVTIKSIQIEEVEIVQQADLAAKPTEPNS